jgi:hypothetical protein
VIATTTPTLPSLTGRSLRPLYHMYACARMTLVSVRKSHGTSTASLPSAEVWPYVKGNSALMFLSTAALPAPHISDPLFNKQHPGFLEDHHTLHQAYQQQLTEVGFGNPWLKVAEGLSNRILQRSLICSTSLDSATFVSPVQRVTMTILSDNPMRPTQRPSRISDSEMPRQKNEEDFRMRPKTFESVTPGQMNRNLACLTGVRSSNMIELPHSPALAIKELGLETSQNIEKSLCNSFRLAESIESLRRGVRPGIRLLFALSSSGACYAFASSVVLYL